MPLPLARSLGSSDAAGIHGNHQDAILRATPFAFYERPAEAVPESSGFRRQKMYHQKYQNPFWIYQKLIQKVENTTQALSFKRMISDKGHLRLSPQDFPIGSAFRFFSAFGPADSVTLLREAGWIARMGWSDCEGTLILLTVDVLLKPWRFNVFTSNSWLEPNRSFKERFVKKSQKTNDFSRAKEKNSDNQQLSQKCIFLAIIGKLPVFFHCFQESLCPGLRGSEDPFQQWLLQRPCGTVPVAVPNPPSVGGPNVQRVGGSTFDARDGVTLHQKPVRHWRSFSVALRTNTSKLISMKPQKFQAFSSQSSWKKYEQKVVFPFYLSMDYHRLSWTITDGWRFEVLRNTSWIMMPFQYFPVVIQEPFWKVFTTWLRWTHRTKKIDCSK